MATGTFGRFGVLTIFLLVAVIVIGGLVIGLRYRGSQPIEISQSAVEELSGEIYAGGAVNNPGFYPLTAGDSLEGIVQAAGGTTDSADLSRPRLYIPEVGEGHRPQKIDINRAEVWLLRALPGIGEVRAEAIVVYRG